MNEEGPLEQEYVYRIGEDGRVYRARVKSRTEKMLTLDGDLLNKEVFAPKLQVRHADFSIEEACARAIAQVDTERKRIKDRLSVLEQRRQQIQQSPKRAWEST